MANIFNQSDKLKHMLACATLTVWFKVIMELINPYAGAENTILAVIITLFIGLTKEIIDYICDETASRKDILADFIGTMVVALPLMFI